MSVYGSTGNVDKNGDIVDALRERLRPAIAPAGNVNGQKQLERVLAVVCHAKGLRAPGASA